ncbi:hypothetical protein ACLF3G_06870 [Falsiroseomonas sp. HC035]|uniref:hypothetical protein n=1 Tax=Falsiroseomonas sp. HC035 TaxID=3390999 RepID=UPI003D3179DB
MSVWSGVEAVVAILLGWAAAHLARLGSTTLAPPDAEAVPLLALALAAGLALGVALLLAVPHGDSFRPARIFAPEGPWQIGLPVLLRDFGLPARATLDQALMVLRGGGPGALPGGVALLLLTAAAVLALRRWHGIAGLRALVALLLVATATALLLHYAAHLLAWMLALLNFWAFAIALFVFQRWRYARPRPDH